MVMSDSPAITGPPGILMANPRVCSGAPGAGAPGEGERDAGEQRPAGRGPGRVPRRAGDKKAALDVLGTATSVIDSIADKNVIHKNTAARNKSRLAAAIKSMT